MKAQVSDRCGPRIIASEAEVREPTSWLKPLSTLKLQYTLLTLAGGDVRGTAGMYWPLSTGGVQLQHHVTLVVLDEKKL
jgi:hypothetical protein